MCQECGCGSGATEVKIGQHAHGLHPGGRGFHGHKHTDTPSQKNVSLNRSLLEKNDRLAQHNRSLFRVKQLLVLNVVSSPGSGKTTFIRETAARLAGKLRVGVIVGDLATDNDARRLREANIPVVQITTGTVCHLDADMIFKASAQLNLDELDVLIVENVGNLVCPADFDLGEQLRVVLLSTTEGEDKPLKYPPMFHSASVAVITKTDLAAATAFDRELALKNLQRISHHATIFEVSSRTGEGMDAWLAYLVKQREATKNNGA